MKRRYASVPTSICPILIIITFLAGLYAQQAEGPGQPKTWTTQEDHRHMMAQLGIKRLRPGPSGNENAPNHANYDESVANNFRDLPDPLSMKDGTRVTTAQQWWKVRRPQIVEDFEREVYGRIPADVPSVSWSVVEQVEGTVGTYPVICKRLIGHVDNSAYPAISVDIRMTLVLPREARGPVPVMMMFGPASLPTGPRPSFPGGRGFGMFGGVDPPATWQLIADGWGYAFIDPASIQPDNGAGLTRGIIGLTNRGQPRKPDDWGALLAWAWGASRGLDYLQTERAVDANRVGIEGVSRYGKATLVAMAFDTRFAMALVASSGAGGAKLMRRNFGEAVENLTGSGQYHWMAGNFLKYGAAEADFGSMDANDLPVDAHQLIALCAPRLVFISYGVPEKGDARWVDQKGSFMAAVAAGKVYRLLGAKDLGVGDDYRNAKMPPVNEGLLDGHLAWRQHDGGHTDGPNWRYFIQWVGRFLGHKAPITADRPIPRTDKNSQIAHAQLLQKARTGRIDLYFVGDSITRRWGATDYPEFLENWKANFFGWNAANFGWGGDTTQNILWRLYNGQLDGVNPKVVVLQAGTNNVGNQIAPDGDQEKVSQVTRGIKAIIDLIQIKAPQATIILMGIFPRNDNMQVMSTINKINHQIAGFADGKRVIYLNINDKLADPDGRLLDGVVDPDKLHLSIKGYQIWADALRPILYQLLGQPADKDHAPPPTGDPSRQTR